MGRHELDESCGPLKHVRASAWLVVCLLPVRWRPEEDEQPLLWLAKACKLLLDAIAAAASLRPGVACAHRWAAHADGARQPVRGTGSPAVQGA